jgi:repressor LexA
LDKSISQHIEEKRREAGLSGTALAAKAGIPEKTLRKLQDGTTTDPRYKTLLALSRALDCTLSELIGETTPDSGVLALQSKHFFAQWENLTEENRAVVVQLIENLAELEERLKSEKEVVIQREIPLYSLPVSAGTGSFLDSDDYEYVSFPADELPSEACFAVKVTGDSMEPAFYEGDIVFVEPSRTAENGDVVVALINGESFIKQYRNGKFISFNPSYAPIIPGDYDSVRISGIVRTGRNS